MKRNSTLAVLATTPLTLHILMLTYQGTSVQQLPQKEALLQQQIWTDYVEHMVGCKGDREHYPLNQTTTWLSWLALQMRQHSQTIFYLEQLQPDWLPKADRTSYSWSVRLVVGLVFLLLFWPLFGLGGGGLLFGLVGGLLFGLPAGLATGLFAGLKAKIEPAEVLTWSWKDARGLLVVGLVAGLLFGLVAGLSPEMTPGGGPARQIFGLSKKQLTERPHLSPNDGIRRSAKNGVFLGLVTGLLAELVTGLAFGLGVGLGAGLLAGLGVGLAFGLGAAVQHYTLRFWLWCTHIFPWKAQPFLDDAATRILLRRVGGGYSFVHRLLLDHFADLNTGPTLASATPPSAPSHPPSANTS